MGWCEKREAQAVCFMPIALTFREEQCAAYNHRTDLFKSFPGPMDWVPRYTGVAPRDQCKLTCQARALGYYYVLEPRVRTRDLQAQRLTHFPVACMSLDRFTQSCLSMIVPN